MLLSLQSVWLIGVGMSRSMNSLLVWVLYKKQPIPSPTIFVILSETALFNFFFRILKATNV